MGALTDGRAPGFMEGSMTHPSRRVPRALLAVGLVAVSAAAAAPARAAVTPVAWHGCNDAIGLECALYSVPRDYSQSSGPSLQLSLVRMPAADSAHRIGSLFVNFGGPGASGVDGVKLLGDLFAALNQRFDIVGFDPRGTGQSSAAVDCHANQETQGVYAQPFATPENLDGGGTLVARDNAYVQRCVALNGAILPYLSTANVARDLDVLRQAVGDDNRAAVVQAVYAKQLWPLLALSLSMAQAGDGVGIRAVADFFYGRLPDGTYDPFSDRFFTISAVDQQYPSDVNTFLEQGAASWETFDHAWWNSGYGELAWGLYPVAAKGRFTGPFQTDANSPTILVVGTTYDPATPDRVAKRLVAVLGQARPRTMRGDR